MFTGYNEAKIIICNKKQKNPAISAGYFCKQFRRLIMIFYHFFFESFSSEDSLSFL